MNVLLCLLLLATFPLSLAQPQGQSIAQDKATNNPTEVLQRAREVMGFEHAANRVLHFRASMAAEQNYQSDRMYPPFFSNMVAQEVWFDPASAVLRVQSETIFPGGGPSPVTTTLDDGKNAEFIRGDNHVPIASRQVIGRALNAWAVIADWSHATAVRALKPEIYRDYTRIVLSRQTAAGEQRLYLDPKSGFPVKLDYLEPHYLWGQRHIEYVWSTWTLNGGVFLPGSAFRVADGDVELSQTTGTMELGAPDAAPPLAPPPAPAHAPADLPLFLQPVPPQATQVAANLYLLTNPGYTEGLALVNNEVYVLDATQGEDRARQDAEQITRLFPGQHKINVVVTDLAWPHIAGLRFWVSRGATIIAHPAAREFLQKVIDRNWTLAPDALQLQRNRSPVAGRMNFLAISQATNLAGGRVRVVPIDGIGSEVALMVYLPEEKFLWASDYIQTLDQPTLYAAEVLGAAQRAGFSPERVAAEHLPLTDWKAVQAAQTKSPEQHGKP